MTRPHLPLSRRVGLAIALVIVALAALPSCGSDEPRAAGPVATTVTTTAANSTTSTTEPEPAYRSWIANVRPEVQSVTIHDSPGGPQLQLDTKGDGTLRPVAVDNPLPSGAPTTFLVKQRSATAVGSDWIEVYLPVRPNGSTGWIQASDATLTNTDLAATINLTTHQLELTDAGNVVVTYPVAAGEAATPTPTGLFYVKELVEPPNAGGAYGPIAYGLSAFSPTLVDTEAFADGVIGIHGTNRPDLIGQNVSHGCVRMNNDSILDLERHSVPLGMPVTITA